MAGLTHPPLQNPKRLPPTVRPGTTRPSTRRAVLFSVNGTAVNDSHGHNAWTTPTMCSVFIEDHLPARSGYTLPADFSTVYAAGVTEWYTGQLDKNKHPIIDPVYGPWACDPVKMVGGSWVLVDMETKSVVTVLQGTSNVAPSQINQQVQGHNHSGQQNSKGEQMPSQIGSNELQYTDTPGTGPVVAGSPTFTLADVGQTTFDASCSFSLDMTRDNTWLSKVLVYLVKQGGSAPTAHTKAHAELPPTTDGNYSPVISGIPFFRDTGWDVYVAYQDLAKYITTPTLVGTVSMPSLPTPSQTGTPTFTYTDAGNLTFDASFSTQLDTNVNQCEVLFFLVRHSGPAPDINTTVHTRMPSVSSGLYAVKMKNCPGNVTGGWDVYAAYKDLRHSMSTPTLIGTMASNAVSMGGVTPMPSGIVSSGPTVTAFSVTRGRTTGAAQEMQVSLTETDFTSTVPAWLAAIELVVRTHSATADYITYRIDPASSTSGSYSGSVLGVAGTPHDVGVRYVGVSGQKSAIVWPSGGSNVADPDGVMLSNTDGTMAYARHNSAVRTALDSTGRLIGNIYDGTNSRTPANITTALDGSGRIIGSIYDGTNSRTPASITATILSAGGIDFSSALHTNKTLDNIADGTSYKRVAAADITSGHVLKTGSAGAYTIKGVGDASTLSLDSEIADGSTYARVRATELSTGRVKQLNDGTNTRTAAQVAGAIDTSSRIIGSIYDGTNSRTPANITTALDGSGRLIGSIYDGTTALTPANFTSVITTSGTVDVSKPKTGVTLPRSATDSSFTTAVDSSGRIIGNIYDGTNSRTPANVTTAIDGSGRIIGSVYDGTTALTPANLTSAVNTSGQVKVANATGNLPYANSATAVQTAIDSSGRVIGSLYDGTNSRTPASITATVLSAGGIDFSSGLHTNKNLDNIADGATYQRVKATELSSGLVTRVNDGTGNVRTAAAIAINMDSSGNSKIHEFSGTAGIVENPDGSLSGFPAAPGASSAWSYSFPAAGAWVYAESHFKLASTGNSIFCIIGNNTNGYGISWNSSDNTVRLTKWVSGTKTNLGTIATITQDTNVHAWRLTVTAGATNTIEGSFDNNVLIATDNSLTLTSGTWSVTLQDGAAGTTKFFHFETESSFDHYTKLASQVRSVVAQTADTHGSYLTHGIVYQEHIAGMTGTGNVNLDGIPDGTTYAKVAAAGLSGGYAVKTGASGAYTIKGVGDSNTLSLDTEIVNGTSFGKTLLAGLTAGYASKTSDGITQHTIKGVGDSHTLSLDSEIADGTTYQRVLATELSSGTVKQLNDGTNVRTAAQVAAAIDTSSNLLANPFGNTSGVKVTLADGSLSGFANSAGGTSSVQTYPAQTAICVYLDFVAASTTGTFEVGIGNTTNGYSVKWTASGSSGSAYVTRYKAGAATQLGSGPLTSALFASGQACRIRLAVDFFNEQVEAVIEYPGQTSAFALLPTSDSGGPWGTLVGSNLPIWIQAAGTSGKIQNLQVNPRGLFCSASQPILYAIDPTYLTNGGHALLAGVVDSRSIANNAVTSGKISGMTGSDGAVSLDKLPDGSTYARVKAAGLTSGNVTTTQTTPFGSGITENSDGSWSGFSSSGSATAEALTVAAGHVITIEGQFSLAATGNDVVILLGNETNGYGLRWKGSTGVVGVVKYVSGTVTVLGTVATVTQDTNLHSFEITITCVSSSSVKVEAAWDNLAPLLETDTSLNLTTGTWTVNIYDGNSGTTKFWNFVCGSAQATYSSLPAVAQGAITSTGALLSTGPIKGASTTSGTQTYVIPTYTSAGAAVASTLHAAQGSVSAVSTSTTVTLSGQAAFTSKTSYTVVVTNTTTATAVPVTITSGTSFTFTSVNTDVYTWFAVGT